MCGVHVSETPSICTGIVVLCVPVSVNRRCAGCPVSLRQRLREIRRHVPACDVTTTPEHVTPVFE